MEDIVQATGVSRYGLYNTFGNKRELFEASLQRFAESMGRQSFLQLAGPDASIAHIRQIFDDRVTDMCNLDENKGCLFIHSTMQLAPQDEELRGVLRKFMSGMSKLFSIGLDSAKEKGEVREDLDTWAAGELLTSTMFGLAVMGRSGFSKEDLNRIVETTLASFSG